MFDTQLLINGEYVGASNQSTYDHNDPISNEVATRAAAATTDDAIAAVNAAAAAFPEWSSMGPSARREVLLKAADILAGKADDFVEAMQWETGASEMWARFNCMLASGMLKEAASLTTQIAGEIIPADKPGVLAMGVRQPAGVSLGIAPWNAPVILGTRSVALPLACGNTVILKGSELCPRTHALIADSIHEAGAPKGAINFISNAPADAPEIVKTLINQPAVKRVNFTGSTRVGRVIAELCAKQLKPCLLELGGKAPLVILDDADLDEAVNAVAFGAFFNQGQICMSTERVICDEKVADEFVAKLKDKTATLKAGNPRTSQCPLGSMIGREPAEKVKTLISDAVAKGADLVIGGELEGTIMQPAIVDKVTSLMSIYSDESFGPVVSVIRASGEEEAITLANDTEYGLSAAVFSRDVSRAMRVARQIESGICHVNGPTVYDEGQMPFGGVKASGYGRFGGKAGIAEFTDLRWITIHDTPQHYPY